ncbi:hypothetical protein GPECTOR_46g276 [Gonium pectorale]|uniref:50S ribosomal protein L22, chloroplastic n=1 Tax=Gonium pectorale TaxID=33097 RepID=A0A150G8N5_GONPE|nr:hypothetical protein GPECTOR_46g276 [Gonium pectorale]|eukprot:KXZ46207.1 hypothetical protein GPECTOR_46g276 [Gonium pectorale]
MEQQAWSGAHITSRLTISTVQGTAPCTPRSVAALSPACQLRSLHSSRGSLAATGGGSGAEGDSASAAAGSGREQAQQHSQQEQAAASGPVRNPLQAALEAAGELTQRRGPGQGLAEASQAAGLTGGRRRQRTWVWYDVRDEREERLKERRRLRYEGLGTAYLTNVPQSMKKMDRIIKLTLEEAYKDATEAKGLNGDKLVVGAIYATKGMYEKGMTPMGKGGSGRRTKRKSHLRVVLREARGSDAAFSARVVPPLMAAWARAGAEPARWRAAAAGAGGAAAGGPRPRFAYRLEV